MIEVVTAKFDIPSEKIKAIVHVKGTNVVVEAKVLQERHGWASVRCAGHTLIFAVKKKKAL